MLRQYANIIFSGGFTRLSQVHQRMTKNFPTPLVDQLLTDGVIRTNRTRNVIRIITTACVQDSDSTIDLRDFQTGARQAIQLSVENLFSPSMMDFAVNGAEPCEANEFLKGACTGRLYRNLVSYAGRVAKSNEGILQPQTIDICSIVDGLFEEDDNGEKVSLTVACSIPYTRQPYEKEETASDLEHRINTAGDDKEVEETSDVEKNVEEATAVSESKDKAKNGVLHIVASFGSPIPSSGDLEWVLEDLLLTAYASIDNQHFNMADQDGQVDMAKAQSTMDETWSAIDKSNQGYLGHDEAKLFIETTLHELGIPGDLTEESLTTILEELDNDGSGHFSKSQMIDFFSNFMCFFTDL
ncbi:unnamed protein product [Aphanomyces euteiches]